MDLAGGLRPDIVDGPQLHRGRPSQQELQRIAGRRDATDANDGNAHGRCQLPDRVQRQRVVALAWVKIDVEQELAARRQELLDGLLVAAGTEEVGTWIR